MYKLIVIGNEVHVNSDGYRYTSEEQTEKLLPDTKNELARIATDTLLFLQKQRLQSVLGKYGYNSLGDVNFYANQNDTEAQALVSWYSAYDTEVWNYIDSLPTKTKTQILTDLKDMTAIEKQIFQNSISAAPLP